MKGFIVLMVVIGVTILLGKHAIKIGQENSDKYNKSKRNEK